MKLHIEIHLNIGDRSLAFLIIFSPLRFSFRVSTCNIMSSLGLIVFFNARAKYRGNKAITGVKISTR